MSNGTLTMGSMRKVHRKFVTACCAVMIHIMAVTHVESRVRLEGRKVLLTAESVSTFRASHLHRNVEIIFVLAWHQRQQTLKLRTEVTVTDPSITFVITALIS